jgi:hypothetical protein
MSSPESPAAPEPPAAPESRPAPESPPNSESPQPSGAYAPAPSRRPPSGAWHGALRTALTYLSAAWILVYTLLSVPPVEALGAWNYVGVLGLFVAVTALGRTWRGDEYVRPVRTTRV